MDKKQIGLGQGMPEQRLTCIDEPTKSPLCALQDSNTPMTLIISCSIAHLLQYRLNMSQYMKLESDIRVDSINRIYKDQPYTVQPGGCGEPGLYIHLTPDYLMNNTISRPWGPRGEDTVIFIIITTILHNYCYIFQISPYITYSSSVQTTE
ncbi:chloride channel [Halocaridina rubra]|uniref:Chloride channel n=1 Tax=Halocaridina rubra TaxID=373956 RepID=A0AAN8WUH8_HALRR